MAVLGYKDRGQVLPKQRDNRLALASLVILVALVASCGGGGGGGGSSTPPPNPVPSITSLSPSSATAGAAAQTLTINGTNFLSSSTVTYNSVAHTATFVNSTQLTISLTASDQATAGAYAVVVANPSPGGGASNSFTFTVNNPVPAISAQPESQTVTAPATAAFSVTATGTGSLSYQWYKNGAAISGATSATYTTPATTTGANGAGFTVTVADSFGSTTSTTAILTVNPAPTLNLSPVGPVLIGGQPQNQTVIAPASATFSATAIGTEPISYQWNENGAPISGATSATYTTPATSSADNGKSFTVTVTNSVNGFTSAPATLTVVSAPVAPAVIASPQEIQTVPGNTAPYYVVATGTAPLSYQWSKNGTPIGDATDPTYASPPVAMGDNNAEFSVTVTNSAGSVTVGGGYLIVDATAGGLGGFQPLTTWPSIYPGNPSDLIGVQYKFQVITDEAQVQALIFDHTPVYTPGQTLNSNYDIHSIILSFTFNFPNGTCTTAIAGTTTMAQASLQNVAEDYPYAAGLQPAVGTALNTSDPVNWPVQTFLGDMIPGLWAWDSMSQFGINGLETSRTVQRGGTLTDISGFQNCGLPMLSTTYRMWTITTQVAGYYEVVNQAIAPDADAQYMAPWAATQINSEQINVPAPATFTVQYWDFALMTESNPVWTPITTFTTMYVYDGNGQNYGEHVVSVNGQDRIEISNVPGNSYLPGNLPFAIAPP
jgi:hypothetical protein